jgi:uncharacterized protein (DUF58 family)
MRPTTACLYLAVVLFFVLLGAVNYQSNAAYVVLAVVGSTAVVSLVHAWRNLSGIRLLPGRTFPAFAGEPLRAQVTLAGGGHDTWALVVDAPEIAEDDGVPLERLAADGSATVELVLPGRPRGRHGLARLRVASIFPLGLVRVQLDVPVTWSWVVYPAPLAGGMAAEDDGDGQQLGGLVGTAGDFHGHRLYQTGDSQRRVDWRAVARGRPLLVKDYLTGAARECWIDWADHPAADPETRLSLMTGRVMAAERDGLRYGLRLPGHTREPATGEAHYHECLSLLALHQVRR